MAQQAGLRPDYLKRQISDQHVLRFAEYCTDFELIGPYLGLKKHELETIDGDKRKTALKRRALLEIWQEKDTFEATYWKLVEAFMKCDKNQSAFEICQILSQEEGKWLKNCPQPLGADPEIFLRGGPESKLCKMKGIHSKNVQH